MRHLIFSFTTLLSVSFISAVYIDDSLKDLKSICADRSIDLRKISHVRQIIKLLESNPPELKCSDEVKNLILDIEPVINDEIYDVCSIEKAEQIANYYVKHVSLHDNTNSKGIQTAANSLIRFFIGFGFKVSSICKKIMINSLELDSHFLLSPEDFKTMEIWTENFGLFIDMGIGPNDFDDLLLMKDLSKLESLNVDDRKILISTVSNNQLKKIQVTCERRFRPIYKELILPLVYLSNIGFNYKGEELARELQELSNNVDVYRWYKITYLCETLRDMKLVEEEEDKIKTDGLDKSLVRIFDKQATDDISIIEDKDLDDFKHIEQITYRVEDRVSLEDLVVDNEDTNLQDLIEKFDRSKAESDHVRQRLLNKMARLLKDCLLKGEVNIVNHLLLGKGVMTNTADQKEDIIKSIDDYAQQDPSRIDRPVSGLKEYGKRFYQNSYFKVNHGNVSTSNGFKSKRNIAKILYRSLAVILLVVAISITIG